MPYFRFWVGLQKPCIHGLSSSSSDSDSYFKEPSISFLLFFFLFYCKEPAIDILSKITFYANAKIIVKLAYFEIRFSANIVFCLNVVVKVSSPAVRFTGRRTLS